MGPLAAVTRGPPHPPAARGTLVTLTTDIGWAYSAQMKAVLAHFVRPGSIIDLSHELPAHGIREAAFLLQYMAGGFPSGTIHIAVIDPGVGGRRVPLAIRCEEGSTLIGPDNGLLFPLAEYLGFQRAYRLLPERIRPGFVPSATFEGRDVFAPAAGLIAQGVPLRRLGTPHIPRQLRQWPARRVGHRWHGEVLHVDRFGNAITSIPTRAIPKSIARVRVTSGFARRRILPRVRTYEELGGSSVGVLGSSFDLLELAAREGRAADRLRIRVGDSVELEPVGSRRRLQQKERKYIRT